MGAFNAGVGIGYSAIVPAAARTGTNVASIWGDTYMSALIMGHDGGGIMGGTLVRGSNKPMYIRRNNNSGFPTDYYYSGNSPEIGATISSDGTDVTITLYITNGDAALGPDYTEDITVLGAADTLHLLQIGISQGAVTVAQCANGNYAPVRTSTIKVYYAGESAELSAQHWFGQRTTANYPIITQSPWTNQAWPTRLYSFTQCFVATTINIGGFSAGTVSDDFDFVYHSYAEQAAWDRNSALYLPPGWCPARTPP